MVTQEGVAIIADLTRLGLHDTVTTGPEQGRTIRRAVVAPQGVAVITGLEVIHHAIAAMGNRAVQPARIGEGVGVTLCSITAFVTFNKTVTAQ